MNKYYPDEPVNIHMQSLIHIIQENNWVITTQKRVRLNYHYSVVMENGSFPYMLHRIRNQFHPGYIRPPLFLLGPHLRHGHDG